MDTGRLSLKVALLLVACTAFFWWCASIPLFSRSGGRLSYCESSLKNIATALEMWYFDHHGYYPEGLLPLVPNYLRSLPQCPPKTRESLLGEILSPLIPGYHPRYVTVIPGGNYAYRVTRRDTREKAVAFEIICQGERHKELSLPRDYPRYTSEKGLLRSP